MILHFNFIGNMSWYFILLCPSSLHVYFCWRCLFAWERLPNRNICFNCCGKSSICWEAKENSQSIPTSHKHSLRPEESIYRLVCFPQWKRLVLSWDGKMPACTDEVQVYTPGLIHTYNLYTYRTPDGEPSIIPVEVPLSPNTQLSKWRPVPSLPLSPIHL